MEILLNPSNWGGLLTLTVLEIFLGIDNIIFIALLVEKLPSCQRDKARILSLILAFLMRIGILSFISWMVHLTTPLFKIANITFSSRNLILFSGGIFLLFQATVELHNRLESQQKKHNHTQNIKFWSIIAKVVIFDAIFSVDSIITAVGMTNDLEIMILAVILSMGIMLLASKRVTNFINFHPTVIVLCLSFLLMIGLSLVAEGLNFHIPKNYLYASIGFSSLIEMFNQIKRKNNLLKKKKHINNIEEKILIHFFKNKKYSIFSKKNYKIKLLNFNKEIMSNKKFTNKIFYVVNNILNLSYIPIYNIMTPRKQINWINIEHSKNKIRKQLLNTPYNFLPICKKKLDFIIGIICVKEFLQNIENNNIKKENILSYIFPPIIVLSTLHTIHLFKKLKNTKKFFVLVTNDFGSIQGLITPSDILKTITNNFLYDKKN